MTEKTIDLSEVKKMKKDQLIRQCNELEIAAGGNRGQLIKRITEYIYSTPEKKTQFAFPTKVLCPNCKTTDNRRTGQKGNIQYRRCNRGHCRRSFPVRGKEVKTPSES